MRLAHADLAVAEYVKATGLDLTPDQRSRLAIELLDFELAPTGLHSHVLVDSHGSPVTRSAPHTVATMLDQLTAEYRSGRTE